MSLVLMLSLVACQGVVTEHVDWVVDGDTFHVDGVSVRILGVDAPELGEFGGEEAKWFLVELLYDEWVVLDCVGVDRYGRRLCDVSLDGVDVGGELVRLGLAREWKE